jgi:hypothetical protein
LQKQYSTYTLVIFRTRCARFEWKFDDVTIPLKIIEALQNKDGEFVDLVYELKVGSGSIHNSLHQIRKTLEDQLGISDSIMTSRASKAKPNNSYKFVKQLMISIEIINR